MSNRKMWKTKNGEKIRIKDLDNGHLLNIIHFLERQFDRELECAYTIASILHGEMAMYYADRNIDAMEEEGAAALFPIYDDLEEEARRRGILQGAFHAR